ncbi:MAG TPA: sensor histidine kinase [Gemmatimonadaceae bacterium]|nr:sensor histidine kinase [Gemmatimonadaceae bacterium]
MPRLSAYILEHTDEILSEWEVFARGLPGGETMDITALRDHAKEMLGVVARALEAPGMPPALVEQVGADRGAGERRKPTAAQAHGAGRAESGFTVGEMVSEFRALRASVTRLWIRDLPRQAATDFADLMRFNEAIDQAIAESIVRFTQEVDRTRDRFLAILGHDLRTPLGVITMSSQSLLDFCELGEPAHTMVTVMSRSARRMNQMVQDLLEFTRTRLGDRMPLERADMDVRGLLDDVVAEVAASYPRCNVRIEANGDLHGAWDRARLAQALTNLVGNAVQHGTATAPILVSARGGADDVVIAVHNEGPAIPPDELTSIFEAMTHGGGDQKRDRRHMGLGLFIVDQIVTAHGGTVGVESSASEGTTFTVRLPRAAR